MRVLGGKPCLDNALDTLGLELERLGAHDGGVDEVETERVGAVLVDDLHRVIVVLKPLGHLLAIPSQDQAVDDVVLESGAVEKAR